MTNEHLRRVIGENIRQERLARNLSVDELAKLIGRTPGFLGLIERGERGATALTLHRLADLWSISIDNLFYGNPSATRNVNDIQVKRNKLSSLTNALDNEQLDLITSIVKSVQTMERTRSSRAGAIG